MIIVIQSQKESRCIKINDVVKCFSGCVGMIQLTIYDLIDMFALNYEFIGYLTFLCVVI